MIQRQCRVPSSLPENVSRSAAWDARQDIVDRSAFLWQLILERVAAVRKKISSLPPAQQGTRSAAAALVHNRQGLALSAWAAKSATTASTRVPATAASVLNLRTLNQCFANTTVTMGPGTLIILAAPPGATCRRSGGAPLGPWGRGCRTCWPQ